MTTGMALKSLTGGTNGIRETVDVVFSVESRRVPASSVDVSLGFPKATVVPLMRVL
jgi:hypothetical protein